MGNVARAVTHCVCMHMAQMQALVMCASTLRTCSHPACVRAPAGHAFTQFVCKHSEKCRLSHTACRHVHGMCRRTYDECRQQYVLYRRSNDKCRHVGTSAGKHTMRADNVSVIPASLCVQTRSICRPIRTLSID